MGLVGEANAGCCEVEFEEEEEEEEAAGVLSSKSRRMPSLGPELSRFFPFKDATFCSCGNNRLMVEVEGA